MAGVLGRDIDSSSLPKLPACQLCHARKVKCDSRRPKCASCTKNGSECTIADSNGGPPISREYLAKLERRAGLIARSSSTSSSSNSEEEEEVVNDNIEDPKRNETAPSHQVPTDSHEESPYSMRSAETPSASLHGTGINFMTALFTNPEWRNSHANVLQTLLQASGPGEPNVAPNELPSEAVARICFDQYLHRSQIQAPILLRRDVQELFGRVFPAGERAREASPHDLFRTFMILAIGAVIPFRNRSLEYHPFGYYLAAMRNFDPFFLTDQIAAIQDLLLISRFGIYYHIGTSIWEIIRMCMSMCIEQGLHSPSGLGTTPLEDQIRRRVFWISYLMDRYSSTTLNRPFAISDRDIKVELPADTNEAEILAPQDRILGHDHFSYARSPSDPGEMSVFLLCVRLRMISSRIQYELSEASRSRPGDGHDGDELTLSGRIFTTMENLLKRLDEWRNSAPSFQHPQNLYERQEWYDLLQARESFHLVRRAVDLGPKRDGVPSRKILRQCLDWAIRIIHIYSDLFEQSIVTYTRSYFQMMITAGFSVVYYASVSTSLESPCAEECRKALLRCGQTLRTMTLELSDANHYVSVFEALHHHISHKLDSMQACLTSQVSNEGPVLSNAGRETGIETSYGPDVGLANGTNSARMRESHENMRNVANAWNTASGFDVSPVPIDAFEAAQDGFNWDFLNGDMHWNMSNYVWGDVNEAFGGFGGESNFYFDLG